MVKKFFSDINTRFADPFVVFFEKQGHFFDTNFPFQKRIIHTKQPIRSYIVIYSLGDSEQTIDLQLFEIDLTFKFFYP
jgi:hypothetical protein